jgi:hypothetical protein
MSPRKPLLSKPGRVVRSVGPASLSKQLPGSLKLVVPYLKESPSVFFLKITKIKIKTF